VVTEQDVVRQAENTVPTNDWVLYTRNAGTGEFVSGPQTPPLGVGSFHTVTPGAADKVYLFNYDHVGTPLSAIDGMGYATYRTSPLVSPQLPSINLQVDLNGTAVPGGFTTLVFEPIYNTTQDKHHCKNGGWQNVRTADGQPFENQGDCVSYVVSQRRN
jgi:hypothetical protein